MSREEVREPVKFYSIVQGSFRVQVPQDDPSAVRRDWKSADGTKSGTKYERVVNALFGVIKSIEFRAGDYGDQLFIKLDENEQGDAPIIALATSAREAEDFLKKLPNIDLTKEVRLRPFNFEGEGGDEVRGMEIMQQDENGDFKKKISNFFRTKVTKEVNGKMQEVAENTNGLPNPDWDADYSKDEWKIYFLQCRQFLKKYTIDNIIPKLQSAPVPDEFDKAFADPDNIPF